MTSSGPPSQKVTRSRDIRQAILELLYQRWLSSPGLALPFTDVCDHARAGQVAPESWEIRVWLVDLISDGLVEAVPHSFRPNVECYRITGRGADFIRADFPWRKIDEFSGEQRFGGG